MANSSPPIRATTSDSRRLREARSATDRQQRVAGGVPASVIDVLEIVEIDEDQGGRAWRSGRHGRWIAAEFAVEAAPVQDGAERILLGQRREAPDLVLGASEAPRQPLDLGEELRRRRAGGRARRCRRRAASSVDGTGAHAARHRRSVTIVAALRQ